MLTYGSICSGIEAAHHAFDPLGFKQVWSSEVADFPCKVLDYHFPEVKNLGDMNDLPELIASKKVVAPDLICGGTPCQAFSLAGWKNGLMDERGQLTMKFIEIADSIDEIRSSEGKPQSLIFWENVEGVLNNKTNAFGNFLAGLAGFDQEIKTKKWPKAGFIAGPMRNVVWRVLDSKYFGLPQQRKRLYVIAGSKKLCIENIFFELSKTNLKIDEKIKNRCNSSVDLFSQPALAKENEPQKVFYTNDQKFEIFREYTDCLYAAYGTKWNGNAAAYNGSLYISQNDRVRRLTPLECERLMGFPDNYTLIPNSRDTARFQAVGNSWAIPVIEWIGKRIKTLFESNNTGFEFFNRLPSQSIKAGDLFLLSGVIDLKNGLFLNMTSSPNTPLKGNMETIFQIEEVPEKFYISPKACKGILRRKQERDLKMNSRLEELLNENSDETSRSNINNCQNSHCSVGPVGDGQD